MTKKMGKPLNDDMLEMVTGGTAANDAYYNEVNQQLMIYSDNVANGTNTMTPDDFRNNVRDNILPKYIAMGMTADEISLANALLPELLGCPEMP